MGPREILTADIGPVMAIAPRGGYQDVVLSFPIVSATEDGGLEANTNWYAERSWPIFLFNLLRTFGNASNPLRQPRTDRVSLCGGNLKDNATS